MTRRIRIGNREIGAGAPIAVQTMLSVPSTDVEGSARQAAELEEAGCDILRAAVPDMEALRLIPAIKERISIPLVADIHFDYRLALAAVKAGADKIRINPGNIGSEERVRLVAEACGGAGVPIRIGVNGGSLDRELLEKYGAPTAQALAESAMREAEMLDRFGFRDIVISIKSSDVRTTVEACRAVSQRCDYPLHLGVTEAGTERMGLIKNAAGIGAMLLEGIGDTIRVSLTADPKLEVKAGKDILRALGILREGPVIISCPTCGRTRIDLVELAGRTEKALEGCKKPIKVAVMGCAVNGPGEAREADVGIAGGDGCGLIFKKGEIIKKVPERELLAALMEEIERM